MEIQYMDECAMLNVFISSTFYDLKYAREELGDFVNSFGFTPIKFEDGDIGYFPGKDLDISCYNAINYADMVVLIIGGRYGSPSSEDEGAVQDKFNEYISVTRKEFLTAKNNNIPIYVFIDDAVYSEYGIYKKNKKKIESKEIKLEFEYTDDINVFRFIEEICEKAKLAIFQFKKINDIKQILRKQWALLFKEYLSFIKSNSAIKNVDLTIKEIGNKISGIEIMIDKLGQKAFLDNEKEFKEITDAQTIEKIALILSNNFEFLTSNFDQTFIENYIEYFVNKIFESLDETKKYIDYYFSSETEDICLFDNFFKYEGVIITNVKEQMDYTLLDEIKNIDDFRKKIVTRLLKNDCLKHMKFIV